MSHRTNLQAVGTWLGVVAIIFVVIAVCAGVGLGMEDNKPSVGIAAGCGAVALAGFVGMALAGRKGETRTNFYERGVEQQTGKGATRTLAYSDVAAFRYLMAIRHPHTEISITLRPRADTPAAGIGDLTWTAVSVTPGPTAANLENGARVRDLLEDAVAPSLAAALAQGNGVAWTDQMSIEPAGVRTAGSGDLFAWNEIEKAEFNTSSGYVEVFARGSRQAKVDHGEWNAWPGLRVVQERLHRTARGG